MRRFFYILLPFALLSGVYLLLAQERSFDVNYDGINEFDPVFSDGVVLAVPEASINEVKDSQIKSVKASADIPYQKQLDPTPETIKAIYVTSWSAGNKKAIDRLIDLIRETELNAMVIDIKDYSGHVTYDIEVPDVLKYKAKEVRISKINSLIKKLHDEGIYVIARLTVFQDPILSSIRPDLAVQNISTGEPWLDRKGLGWIDPSAKEAWDYNIAIAKDALLRGFDEINFDYIRFPSDGDLSLMKFPFYNIETVYKKDAIREFFAYLRGELEGYKISADLFGLSSINKDDLGIGQVIEYAYEFFDYVSPMVYPSHYAKGFLALDEPAKYPYEVIKYSMHTAMVRLIAYSQDVIMQALDELQSASGGESPKVKLPNSKLRPWIQDFDLGGVPYGVEEVRAQINALYDSAKSFECQGENQTLCLNPLNGWMLWDPANIYTKEALLSTE